jgi:hypothetical protein
MQAAAASIEPALRRLARRDLVRGDLAGGDPWEP